MPTGSGVRHQCFLFRDERWDPLLPGAFGVAALLAIRWVRAGGLVARWDRKRVIRGLWYLVAVAFGTALLEVVTPRFL